MWSCINIYIIYNPNMYLHVCVYIYIYNPKLQTPNQVSPSGGTALETEFEYACSTWSADFLPLAYRSTLDFFLITLEPRVE